MWSLIRPFPWAATGLLAVMLVMLTGAIPALGDEVVFRGGRSLVGGLAVPSDLQATSGAESAPALLPLGVAPVSRQSMARQSVPARNRSASYRDADVFTLSKFAVPLLVADLEPRISEVAQPMSGRSVGARPSAAWTRTLSNFSESLAPARTAAAVW